MTDTHGSLRRIAALFVAVALIGATIWLLQPDRTMPFPGKHSGGTAGRDASFGSSGAQGAKLGAAGGPPLKIGEAAPQFTLLDVNGNVTRLSDFRGKTVVLNFWATWCIPCRQEFPELASLYDKHAAKGLVVLGVDLQEDAGSVRKFAAEYRATFPIVIDAKGDVAQRYRLLGPPTTFFIDGAGVLRAQQLGVLTDDALTRKLGEAGFTP